MIGDTKGKFVIASPTKTGALSLLAFGRSSPGLKEIARAHMPYVPSGYENAIHVQLVRDPYSRFISMLNYNRYVKGWQYNAWKDLSLEEYVEWFAGMREKYILTDRYLEDLPQPLMGRAPYMWLMSQSEFEQEFEADEYLEIGEVIGWIRQNYPEVKVRDRMNKVNMTKNHAIRGRIYDSRDLRGRTLKIVNEMWAEKDCLMIGYRLRKR